jgi:hypothetical protein
MRQGGGSDEGRPLTPRQGGQPSAGAHCLTEPKTAARGKVKEMLNVVSYVTLLRKNTPLT